MGGDVDNKIGTSSKDTDSVRITPLYSVRRGMITLPLSGARAEIISRKCLHKSSCGGLFVVCCGNL